MKNPIVLLIAFLIGLIFWWIPEPEGVDPNGWNLFAIFLATMITVIFRPLPMGVLALLALAISIATGVLSFQQAFSGFSNDVVWLIVFAFFVARGFILTGLGSRLAYKIMSVLGKNSLGLGYGLVATDLILAPAIPSVTARVGGIIYPMVKSLADVFTGSSHDPKMGGFLSITAYQGSVITSAMFLTAMAGNPLLVEILRGQGIQISWVLWALCALVPGLLSLFLVPLILFKKISPTIRKTPHAKQMAEKRLKEMGPMKPKEWMMLATFVFLLVLWMIGPLIHFKAASSAMMGLVILLLSGILKWKDVLEESGAWDTFIWFSTFVTMSSYLSQFGLMSAFGYWVEDHIAGFPWELGFCIICVIYFYTHYFFASNVAHIGAMFAPLFIGAVAMGTPPMLAALTLSFFSSLFAGLTHYGSGPAPILFGTGYVSVATWWRYGFLISLVNIAIWLLIGGLWWKVLSVW